MSEAPVAKSATPTPTVVTSETQAPTSAGSFAPAENKPAPLAKVKSFKENFRPGNEVTFCS